MRVFAFALCLLFMLAQPGYAQLRPMSDNELAQISGQGLINLLTSSSGDTTFQRITFGVDLATQLNMQQLNLGLYDRSGTSIGNDILINNFALGTVNADGSISAFQISQPYVEYAYEGGQVVGVRIGFTESKGVLSGDIKSLSGNVNVAFSGSAQAVYDKANIIQQAVLTLGGIYNTSTLSGTATLVDSSGNANSVRATQAGIVNGDGLTCTSGCLPIISSAALALVTSSNCSLLGIGTCFSLSQFQSLNIGNTSIADNASTKAIEGAAQDFFISLQSKNVNWKSVTSGEVISALAGAFINLPTINLTLAQALNGTTRQDTCLGSAVKGC
ncbi:MAG: hypothetical protein GAK45_00344 [Pseudomonas citronellolis]|nr:MAG: hypothetical protein GAK45_00344 [Pseudomonas citronellolis]